MNRRQLALLTVSAMLMYVTDDAMTAERSYTREDTAADKTERLEWWREAKLGVRFTWGAFTKFGGEYKGKKWGDPTQVMGRLKIPVEEYEKIAATFNPTAFDAKEWTELAQEAGAKYVLFTAKNDDGFVMYDSDVTDYSLVDFTPFKRDALAELKQACDKAGLKFGVVFPGNDGHFGLHSQGKEEFKFQQMMELIEKYEPAIFEFSGKGSGNQTIDKYMRWAAPDMVVNSYLSGRNSKRGDYAMSKSADYQAFETVISLSDSLGYKPKTSWKTSEAVIKSIEDTFSKGGNVVINVGPDAEGNIPPEAVKLLKEIGEWMKGQQ